MVSAADTRRALGGMLRRGALCVHGAVVDRGPGCGQPDWKPPWTRPEASRLPEVALRGPWLSLAAEELAYDPSTPPRRRSGTPTSHPVKSGIRLGRTDNGLPQMADILSAWFDTTFAKGGRCSSIGYGRTPRQAGRTDWPEPDHRSRRLDDHEFREVAFRELAQRIYDDAQPARVIQRGDVEAVLAALSFPFAVLVPSQVNRPRGIAAAKAAAILRPEAGAPTARSVVVPLARGGIIGGLVLRAPAEDTPALRIRALSRFRLGIAVVSAVELPLSPRVRFDSPLAVADVLFTHLVLPSGGLGSPQHSLMPRMKEPRLHIRSQPLAGDTVLYAADD